MKLKRRHIVRLRYLNLRVLHLGKEILVILARSLSKTKPVANQVWFTAET